MKESKKLYRNRIRSRNAKIILTSAVVASSITGVPMVEKSEKVEAAELYYWEKYSLSTLQDGQIHEGVKVGYRFYDMTRPDESSPWDDRSGTVFDSYSHEAEALESLRKLGKYVKQGPSYTTQNTPYWQQTRHDLYAIDYKRILAGTVTGTSTAYKNNEVNSDGFLYIKKGVVNNPPVSVATIPSQSIAGKGQSININLASYFQDPNGDAITYSVSSSNNGIASATVGGSNLSLVGNSKGSVSITVTANDGKGGSVSQSFTTTVLNQAPTNPILTIPSVQFEHGDKHYLGVSSTDPDGDVITYQWQASYGGSWENIGTGTSLQYTVPNNKGTSVKFRVIASDGQLTSTSAESTPKSIREVMYYWNKFNNNHSPGGWGVWYFDSQESAGDTQYTDNLIAPPTRVTASGETADQKWEKRLVFHNPSYVPDMYSYLWSAKIEHWISRKTAPSDSKGTLVKTLQAGYNAYINGVQNSDGYWYERGQRVLASDTTPPIIEITEPITSSANPTITVKTHDLSAIKQTKWAKGNQSLAYFSSAGTQIGTSQTTTSFQVSENGVYTVYAEDTLGNKAVQIITVTKANRAPNKPILAIPQQQFEHGDKHAIGITATDPDGNDVTVTLKASYGNGAWVDLYTGPPKAYEYTVPKDKGNNVRFLITSTDGIATTNGDISEPKSIQEVKYHWSKFNNKVTQNWAVNRESLGKNLYVYGQATFEQTGKTGYYIDESGNFQLDGGVATVGTTNGTYQGGSVYVGGGSQQLLNYSAYFNGEGIVVETIALTTRRTGSSNNKGSFITSLQAGYSAYQHGVRNADGYWYERGQRALEEDKTPPIIELTEQSNYAPTSTVTVKTHDLNQVAVTKWAEGEQSVGYFGSQGTSIGTGQTSDASFTVSKNGKYTVYSEDNKGNKAIQVIEVKKVNTAPIINSIQPQQLVFKVVDDSTMFKINVLATDPDGQALSSKVTYGTNASATAPGLELVLSGSKYDKGFNTSPITVTVNDGIIDSQPKTLNDYIVIKVDSEADYIRMLTGHSRDVTSFNAQQHKSIHTVYEAVIKYESNPTPTNHTEATTALENMKTVTGISSSDSVSEWKERIDIAFATKALEKAEASLIRVDYKTFETLYNNLALQSNKDLLKDRLSELAKYHTASDLLAPMEGEIARHKVVANSPLSTDIINTPNIVKARESIALTKDQTQANYNTILTERLKEIQGYYMNNKDGLTPEDIGDMFPDLIDPDITTEYDEIKDAFKPLPKNLEHLIKYTNALVEFLRNVNKTSKDNYDSAVAALPTNTGINHAELAKVTKAVNSIYSYRTTFREDQTALTQILTDINSITIGGINTTGYMKEIQKAMKEVTEYNDIALDAEHDEAEKQEGLTQVSVLKDLGKFKTDMQSYLDNGIPSTIINDDKYEYIIKDNLIVVGTVTDNNHTEHTVTAKLGSKEVSDTVTNGSFELSIPLAEGIYIDQPLTVNVNDSLTNKAITVKGKPVISVSNPEVFTEMVKLLESDRTEDLTEITKANLEELLALFNIMISADKDTSPIVIRGLHNRTQELSTQEEGQLETYVKNFIQTNYLKWIYENYQTATADDYEFVGVVREGKPLVTKQNITKFKVVITDYKNSDKGSEVPKVEDYIKWVDMITALDSLDESINSVYLLTTSDTISVKIEEVKKLVEETVPDWSSFRPGYDTKLEQIKAYEQSVVLVETAESDFNQSSHDKAVSGLTLVINESAKQALQERLNELQKVINAVTAVEKAEVSKQEKDIQDAQKLVDELKDSPKKTELLNRLKDVLDYYSAREAVVKAENDLTQDAHNEAKTLVEALTDGELKSDLMDRLEEVQQIIDALNAVQGAESSASDEDIKIAQDAIDLVDTQPIKEELQNRLDAVKDYSGAVKGVVKSEESFDQFDKDQAQMLVDALPPSDNKDKLQERLDEVQKVIEAIDAVFDAERTKDLTDIKKAQALVDILKPSNIKNELNDRLQMISNYNIALDAVVQAELYLTQSSHNTAKSLVDKVSDGPFKSQLINRLSEVQRFINANNFVIQSERTNSDKDISDAQSLIDLVQNVDNNKYLQDNLDALRAVISVEESLDTTSQDTANVLVGSLKESVVKQNLIIRMNMVQKILDAIDAVYDAERTKLREDVAKAQVLVNGIIDGETKQELQHRLDAIGSFNNAEDAVAKAEKDLTQSAHDAAKELVAIVQEGPFKGYLLNRLNEVQEIIDATIGLEQAESTADYGDISNAKDLIDKVDTEPKKTELMDRLNDVIEYADAVKAVVDAERDLTQTTKDTAQVEVDELPPSDAKDRLQDRLDEVQRIIDANTLVTKAESNKTWEDHGKAQESVNQVTTAEEKEKLQNRLDSLKEYLEAADAVTKAEKDKTQLSHDEAKDLVDALPDGTNKTELLDRLQEVQDFLDNRTKEEKAEDAVGKVEGTWNTEDLQDAKDKVGELTDGNIKNDLLDRIEAVEKLILKYQEVTALVEQAEQSKLQTDSDNAKTGLDELVDLAGGANSKTDELQERINEVNRFIIAEKAVVKVEESKIERHFAIAQDLVNQLKDGLDKQSLQDRLDAIKDKLKDSDQDILDKIINGNPDPTPPELADWSDEVVFEESMQDYLDDSREIFDQTGKLTKEDVVQIIRTVNALELAKRWMTTEYISKYETELALVHPIIKPRYPEPKVMYTTEAYLTDESAELELAKALAELLGRDVESVLEEMKDLLTGMEEATTGFYSVQYINAETHEMISSKAYDAEFGDITFIPEAPSENYELIDPTPIEFNLNKDTNGKLLTIPVTIKAVTSTDDTADVEITRGSYTVSYRTQDGQLVHKETFEDMPLGTTEVFAFAPESYKLVEGEEDFKSFELTAENNTSEVEFLVEKLIQTTTPETASIAFARMASMNSMPIPTVTQTNSDVSHQQYLYQASQGALLVTAYVKNPTQENLDSTYEFIEKNILDGRYKIELLKLLQLSEDVIGDYVDPDLTPVYPYKPPVIIPPVTPPPVDNGGSGGNGGYVPPVIQPEVPITPPVIPDTGTVGTQEVVKDVVVDKDGNYSWVIENPTNNKFTLQGEDVIIEIEFDKDLIKETKHLEVRWENLGKDHYRLIAFADGKEVKSFKAKVTFNNSKAYSYMQKKHGEGIYKATPYSFSNGKFKFNANTTSTYFFTKEKRTFSDTGKLSSSMQNSIEEMSSRLIVQGTGKDKFSPNGTATRAHFSAILARAMELNTSDEPTPFKDTKGKWFEKDVQALYESGLVQGINSTKFSPNSTITRQQAVLILYRVLENAEKNGTLLTHDGKLPVVGEPVFTDQAKISEEARTAVATLQELGLLTGQGGKLNPHLSLTRAQLSKLVSGVLKLTGDM